MQNKRRLKDAAQAGKTQRRKSIWISLGIFLNLYLLVTLIFGEMGVLNAFKVTARHDKIQSELHALQIENETLSHQIDLLKNDPQTIERIAREQLGLVKEGELVYEFYD